MKGKYHIYKQFINKQLIMNINIKKDIYFIYNYVSFLIFLTLIINLSI